MRPEKILKYLNILDDTLLKKNLTRGYDSRMFIHHFIKKIGKTSLQIDIFNDKLYGNFNLIYDHLNMKEDF